MPVAPVQTPQLCCRHPEADTPSRRAKGKQRERSDKDVNLQPQAPGPLPRKPSFISHHPLLPCPVPEPLFLLKRQGRLSKQPVFYYFPDPKLKNESCWLVGLRTYLKVDPLFHLDEQPIVIVVRPPNGVYLRLLDVHPNFMAAWAKEPTRPLIILPPLVPEWLPHWREKAGQLLEPTSWAQEPEMQACLTKRFCKKGERPHRYFEFMLSLRVAQPDIQANWPKRLATHFKRTLFSTTSSSQR